MAHWGASATVCWRERAGVFDIGELQLCNETIRLHHSADMVNGVSMYFDVHSHCREAGGRDDVVRLCSVFAREYAEGKWKGGICSVGVHPWRAREGAWESDVAIVRRAAENPRVVAIGEAGLDGCCETAMDVQRQAFEAQVRIAAEAGLPLIVHLVKALDVFFAVFRDCALSVPFVVHGFRGSREMAAQLMDWGGRLSFGAALLTPSEKLEAAVRAVPVERLFLETDEAACGIEAVFEAAARIRGDEPTDLVRAVQGNARNVFRIPDMFAAEKP